MRERHCSSQGVGGVSDPPSIIVAFPPLTAIRDNNLLADVRAEIFVAVFKVEQLFANREREEKNRSQHASIL